MNRSLLLSIILLSFCCCSKKRADIDLNTLQIDTTILSDPFRTFTPDIYKSIEHNDRYKEWYFNGLWSSVYVEKKYFHRQKDSLIYVCSGFKGFGGLNELLNVSKRLILPDKSKKLEISIIYEYAPVYSGSELTLETSFFTHNTPLKKITEKLPPTLKTDKKGKEIKNEDVSIAKYKYRIPDNADNMEISLHTYKSEVLEDSWTEKPVVYNLNEKPDSVNHIYYGFSILLLNRFNVTVNSENLENHIYNHSNPFTDEEIETISGHTGDRPNINEKVQIVGIGETVHGSSTFSDQASKIIKDLIPNGFNRIGIEMSPLLGMKLNGYVNGDASNLDTILSVGKRNFLNNREFKALMGYIRTHNQAAIDKISVFGFDYHPDNDVDEIEEYINEGMENRDSLYFDYLQHFVRQYKGYYQTATLKKILFLKRDKIMSDNVAYITDKMNSGDRIALIAHLGHLSKTTFPKSSAGGYLSEKYGDKYAVIGLFAGGGKYFSTHLQGFDGVREMRDFPLSKPIGRSLEQLCMSINKEQFYINGVDSLKQLDKILYARRLGGAFNVMQFIPFDIRKELDIVWFTRNSESGEMFVNVNYL